ncbi:MAG: hypothetical protein H6741_02815 [Alphaproteobacteria bacterium]|nr:hypothetical protein [Alphaproteobacteria bacterium]MCB9791635.1 hypothetical protein [Alphaproteobacteria bacterium]
MHRVLRYAVSRDGERLWALRYLERTCRPVLEGLVEYASSDEEAESLAEAAKVLEGLDTMPWTRRLEPVQQALALIEPIALAAPLPEPAEDARVRLVEPVDESEAAEPSASGTAEAPSEPEPARSSRRRSSRRERERRPRSRPEPRSEPVEAAPPPPPPPPPKAPLGAAGHSGAPVSTLEGITPQLAEALSAAGVLTIADLLTRIPVEQERLPVLEPEEQIDEEADEIAVSGTIAAWFLRLRPAGRVLELVLKRGERLLRCRWLGEPPPDLSLEVGAELTLAGRVEPTDEGPVMYEALPWSIDGRRVVRRPVYGIEGVDDEELHRLTRVATLAWGDRLLDTLPGNLLRDHRVLPIDEAIRELHLPSGGLRRARTRFVFEELLVHQLRLAATKPVRVRGIAHPLSHELIGRLQVERQFTLDDGQEAVFDEIRRDLRRPVAMNRLLQGDVGTGKALVTLLVAIMVAESKSQVLFLAPDAISAEHRYLFAEAMIRAAGLVPQLVVGDPNPAQLDALRRGEAQVVFATHALAEGGLPAFRKLGLVVAEERGPYGVVQRESLAQKNVHPDLLVITAVPIPSSLAFTIFADYDISVIEGPSQQVVECQVRRADKRGDIYSRIIERLTEGQQALVVFPMVRGADLVDVNTAKQLASALANEAFPGFSVGVYHGAMTRDERARVFEDFERRRFDVLLSTTSIEDAPELANVTALLVENADRYDIVRLHRLRGMVAKGRRAGLCIYVLSEPPSVEGTRLVELVSREQDGFSIAEQDRVARGDEALLGERASELPSFQLADPVRERDLLLRARRAALNLLAQDPRLRHRANRGLARLAFGEDAAPPAPKPRGSSSGGNPSSSSPAASSSTAGAGRARRRRRRRKGGGGGKG